MTSPKDVVGRLYKRIAIVAIAVGTFFVGFAVWAIVDQQSSHTRRVNVAAVQSSVLPALTLTSTPSGSPTSAAPSAPASEVPATTASAASASPAPASTALSAAQPSNVTYTVKRGDNLTVIAAWFNAHGYQPVYAWNRTVIGQDPNLIKPGQVLVVAVKP